MKAWVWVAAMGVLVAGCTAQERAEGDAVSACEGIVHQVLDDAEIPEPDVRAESEGGFLVRWPAGTGLRIGGDAGETREAEASCRVGLDGHVAWLEIDGERVYEPDMGVDAIRARRDEASDEE